MNSAKMLDGNQHFLFILITMLPLLLPVQALSRKDPPIRPSHPFVFMWNDYIRECPDIKMSMDDELWLPWNESTINSPSIYINLVPRYIQLGQNKVRQHIQEAMRNASTPDSSNFIYGLLRLVDKDRFNFLSEFDLVNTVGEAAALGATGVLSWGDMKNATETCFDAQRYVEKVLNPYILNVSKATQLCSEELCSGKGRCVRKQWDEDVFLHLNPRSHRIQRQGRGGNLTVSGCFSQEDFNWFNNHFECMCYTQEPCRPVSVINVTLIQLVLEILLINLITCWLLYHYFCYLLHCL